MSRAHEFLLRQGVGQDLIDEADAGGWLAALLVDRVLLAVPTPHTVADAAEAAGTTPEVVRRILRAQGIPEAQAGERVLSDLDIQALKLILSLIDRSTFEHDLAETLGRIRAISAAMSRVAEVAGELISDLAEANPDPDTLLDEIRAQAPLTVALVDYARNVQMRLAVQRRIAARTLEGTLASAVGFADLSGFTALSGRVDPEELERVVVDFEARAFDSASRHGARVVKTIGDAVMFTATDPHAAIAVAEELTELRPEDALPVGAGVAYGEIATWNGDSFGRAVNLASRLTDEAREQSVLVSDDCYEALGRPDGWKTITRKLDGIGRVKIWTRGRR